MKKESNIKPAGLVKPPVPPVPLSAVRKTVYAIHWRHWRSGRPYRLAAIFTEGEPSRCDKPVSDETMMAEVRGYAAHYPDRDVLLITSCLHVLYASRTNKPWR